MIKRLTILDEVKNLISIKAKAESKMTTATATGSVDAGTGVTLDHAIRTVYSKEIEFKALPNMRFLQFATIKEELGVEPGRTIQMLTYDNLALRGNLTEGVRMKTQALSSSMKQITVNEKGDAISVSELLLKTSFDDIMATATTLLGRNMAQVLDSELRDVTLKTTNVIYGRPNSSSAKVSARVDVDETNILSVATIKDAIEILATNNAPKINGDFYICFIHPHCSRSLRDDNAWINASNYGSPEQLFTGEIGRIDDVRFIESTVMPNGQAPAGSDSFKEELKKGTALNKVDVFQSVIFGENYYGLAVALPVELRDGGVKDFGREHGLVA